MSYKSEFQANNADLQGLIDLANALPEATVQENLDAEMTAQDDLIAQISSALVGKSGMSGTCAVNFLRGTGFNRYYIDANGNSQVSQSTVETKTVMKNGLASAPICMRRRLLPVYFRLYAYQKQQKP